MADTFEEHLCVLFNPDRGVHTGERSPNRGWKLMNHTHATSQTLSGHKEMPNSLLILAPSELFVCVSKSETWVQIKPWHTPILVNPSVLSITSFYLHGSKRLFFVVNFLIAVFNYFGTANYSVIYVKLSLLWWCSKRFYHLVNNTRYYYRLQRKSTLLWPTVLFQCQIEQNGMTLWPTNNHPLPTVHTVCKHGIFFASAPTMRGQQAKRPIQCASHKRKMKSVYRIWSSEQSGRAAGLLCRSSPAVSLCVPFNLLVAWKGIHLYYICIPSTHQVERV